MATTGTMRAWLYHLTTGGLTKNLKLHEHAPRPPSKDMKDKLLIKVYSMSVNPIDMSFSQLGLITRFLISPPASPGMDFCGEVEGIGSAVTAYKVGQRVFGKFNKPVKFGSLAEYLVVEQACIAPLPEGIDVDAAATIGVCGQTAYHSIAEFVKSGDSVFINGGSGGTGTYGIQIAKILGCRVTTTCSADNVEFCKTLGADRVIDYRSNNIVNVLREEAQPFDLIVDNVGTPEDLYHQCHHFLKSSGTFVQVGAQVSLSGAKNMFLRFAQPSFLGGGKRKLTLLGGKNNLEEKQKIASWISEGKLQPTIANAFEFEEADKAYEMLKNGRTSGKIVVHVSRP